MKTISLSIYVTGFVLSLLFTFAAYALVELHIASGHEWPPHTIVIPGILALALAQALVQLVYFLHLSARRGERERLFVLGGAMLIVTILVAGSMWIMTHLNERMMGDPAQMQQYMDSQSGL